ncbi:hypothetical protein FM102_03110 [Corynebacterium glutamicum]|nr:hypothetical protein FM102_03110 [Corynebacterium glutamicum]
MLLSSWEPFLIPLSFIDVDVDENSYGCITSALTKTALQQ